MRIAVPIFQSRVAPVFDWCRAMAVIDLAPGGEAARQELDFAGLAPLERVERLAALNVGTLLCGGISAPVAGLVESRGIRIVPWAAGPVDEVLAAFQRGTLAQPRFMMPGCCGRRWRGGRGRGGRGRRGCGPPW